jgi:hypothetical protein
MSRKATYKPLLFTTTVRNPSRMKVLLNIFSKYDKQVLTSSLCEDIMGEIIRYGLYRPTRGVTKDIENKWGSKRISENSPIGIELLNDKEVQSLLELNPQEHKEAGFDRGWPSRFATVFDFAKELGFVYYWMNRPIKFSEIGIKLATAIEIKLNENYISISDVHPEFEQQAFLNSLAKYQRNNPFVKVLNDNVPLILLLEVIKKINSDPELNGTGISKLELPLVIFWKDSNSEELYRLIKSIRSKHAYQPSWETIIDICVNHIMGGDFKKFKPESIMVEYPDEFIRKMRLTGLISLRGAGRFIDINHNENDKVDYVLQNYSSYNKYASEEDYFNYASTIDENLVSIEAKLVPVSDKEKYLEKWTQIFTWELIKSELTNLATKSLTKDEVLKYLANPVRLEFLTALALKSKFPNVKVVPNYPVDDEGIPTSTAGGTGNIGDIECFEGSKGILVEVTMSEGRTQTMMEVWPISRHLEEFTKKAPESMCYFVAPSLFTDTVRQIDYVKQNDKVNIQPKTIIDFVSYLENSQILYS